MPCSPNICWGVFLFIFQINKNKSGKIRIYFLFGKSFAKQERAYKYRGAQTEKSTIFHSQFFIFGYTTSALDIVLRWKYFKVGLGLLSFSYFPCAG